MISVYLLLDYPSPQADKRSDTMPKWHVGMALAPHKQHVCTIVPKN